MQVTISTNNSTKIHIVTALLENLFPNESHSISGADIDSKVPDTPRGEEIKIGAYNRALASSKISTYGVGIESGLIERYGMWFEEAWACVVVDDKVLYGYSSGLPIPKYVLDRMNQDGKEHGPTMKRILAELNQPDIRDTWGTYSGNLILRDISLQEALRNALVQITPSEKSLYHL